MGRRLGQLTGLFLFVLAMARLSRLFETAPDQQPWQLILLATALLGGIAWWLLSQLISSRSLMLAIFGLGAILLALRITAPETMTMGFIPTGLTPPELGEELGIAWRVIRSGIPPVDPHPGIVAILAVVMWVVGALFTWGSTGGPYAALFLPSLVLYLQFAVFDRIETMGVKVPEFPGYDTMACMEAAHRGELDVGLCLGGNLYGSNPDSAFASEALANLDLLVYLSTTLNTGHAHATARETLILPVLARDEAPRAVG